MPCGRVCHSVREGLDRRMASPSSGTGVLCPAAANAAGTRARQLLLPVVVALVALTRPRPTLGGFREDEHTATVFNASGALPYHHDAAVGKAAVAGLLAALGDRMMTNGGRCSSVGAGTTTVPGGGLIHGLMRCAAGIPCSDCRRCLLRATEVAEREYNGSAGMQVLRLSCMARYESYPFYNATAMWMQGFSMASGQANTTVGRHRSNFTPAANPAPAPRLSPGPPRSPPAAQMQVTRPTHELWTGKRLVALIAPIAVGSVIVLAILGLVMFHRKPPLVTKHVEDGMLGENICYQGLEHITSTEEDEDAEEMSCQCYTYQVLESATCHFTNSNKLGSGGFGTVYKGMLGNGKEVAVKRLKDSKRDLKELEKEISIMANLRHKNLLRFIGYCFEEERRLLVYEYVPNNSLEKFWHKAHLESQKLHWATWFNIIKGVAHGLQYLHGQGILHRDLKPHNVLLDENLNPKIADFDLMRVYDKEKTHESTEKVAGTFGYMAPECTLGRKLQLSIKSDVYSYGVLVLEIITGHKINTFEGENFEGLVEYVWQHWTEKKASDVVDGDLVCVEGSEHERRQAERCVHMALLCVQSDRSRRPTMDLVIAILRNEAIVLPEPSLPGYIDRKSEPAVRRYLPCLS